MINDQSTETTFEQIDMSSTTTSNTTTVDVIESTMKINGSQNDTGPINTTTEPNIIFFEKSKFANNSKQQDEQPT